MKERLLRMAMIILALAMTFTVTGCSSDDDNESKGSGNSGITGTWYGTSADDGIVSVLRISSDGTYEMGYYEDGRTHFLYDGEYRYDRKNESITFYSDDGIEEYDVYVEKGVLEIVGLGTYTKDRPSQGDDGDSQTSMLYGTWRHTFSTGYTVLVINPDGYGSWREYDRNDGGWMDEEVFSYSYDGRSGILTVRGTDYTERYKVTTLTRTTLVLQDLTDGYEGKTSAFTRQ